MIYACPAASSTRFENLTVPSSEALSSTASRIAFHAASGLSGAFFSIMATRGGTVSLTMATNSAADSHSKLTSVSSTSTSEKPPPSSSPPMASGVGRDSGPGVPGGGGSTPRMRIAVPIGTAMNGTRSRGHVEHAAPGLDARQLHHALADRSGRGVDEIRPLAPALGARLPLLPLSVSELNGVYCLRIHPDLLVCRWEPYAIPSAGGTASVGAPLSP